MCYTESVYVCVDELTTELLRRTPRSQQVPAFSRILRESLDSKKFGEESSRSVGSVTREQMKILLRFSAQRLPESETRAGLLSKIQSKGNAGKGAAKSLLSLPVRRFREEVLKEMLQQCPKTEVRDAIVASAQAAYSRLGGEAEFGRVRREFFKLLAEEYMKSGGDANEALVQAAGLSSNPAQLELTPPVEAPPAKEEVTMDDLFPVKTFQDFEFIFKHQEPLAVVFLGREPTTGQQKLALAVGIESWRDFLSGSIMRRNCSVDFQDGKGEQMFKHAAGLGFFKKGTASDEVHRYIKLWPLVEGMKIRYWVNDVARKSDVRGSRVLLEPKNRSGADWEIRRSLLG